MATISIECGVCGGDIELDTGRHGFGLVATCYECKATIDNLEKQIGNMEDTIFEIEREYKHA
jgi:hypothetical protein